MLPITPRAKRDFRIVLLWQGAQDLGSFVEEVRARLLSGQTEGVSVDGCKRGTQGRKGFILSLVILGACSESGYMLSQGKGRAPQFPPLAVGYLVLSPSLRLLPPTPTGEHHALLCVPPPPRAKGGPPTPKQQGGNPDLFSHVINAE